MTTKARRRQKKVERRIYNAKERATRAKTYYDGIRRNKSRGKT